MKTVKFISNDTLQKKFISTLRSRVNNYFKENEISTKGNWVMYTKAFILLSIYTGSFVLILSLKMAAWQALLLAILMGIGEAGIGMSVMHDAAHGAFSRKQWVNNIFSSTMYILGSNTFNWKIQHNILHHTFTNIYGFDQDIETKAALRLCDYAPLKKIHRLQYVYAFFFYGLMTVSKLFTDIGQLIEFNKIGITEEQNSNPKKEIAKLIVAKTIYFFVIIGLPLIFTDFKWWQILIGFAILHITAGMIMSTIFQMAHVVEGAEQTLPDLNGVIANEWVVHEIRATSDFARNNLFLNWYVGGLNFQIEHHLFPNTCHVHYIKLAPIVEKTAREFGIIYNLKPSFGSALVSHIKRLKELGQQKPDKLKKEKELESEFSLN